MYPWSYCSVQDLVLATLHLRPLSFHIYEMGGEEKLSKPVLSDVLAETPAFMYPRAAHSPAELYVLAGAPCHVNRVCSLVAVPLRD